MKYIEVGAIDDNMIDSFRWPSCREADGNYPVCRYLADFVLKDGDGTVLDDMLVTRRREEESYIAEGTLLARPGSAVVSICNVKVPFIAYCIDFSELGSVNRGYWLESEVDGDRVYYKLGRPHARCLKIMDKMEEKIGNFLEFYDYISINKNLNKGFLIECTMTIQDLHKSSGKAFNFDFIKENSAFVLLNLVNSINIPKSLLLIDTVRELGNLTVSYIVGFFPGISTKTYTKHLLDAIKREKIRKKQIMADRN